MGAIIEAGAFMTPEIEMTYAIDYIGKDPHGGYVVVYWHTLDGDHFHRNESYRIFYF